MKDTNKLMGQLCAIMHEAMECPNHPGREETLIQLREFATDLRKLIARFEYLSATRRGEEPEPTGGRFHGAENVADAQQARERMDREWDAAIDPDSINRLRRDFGHGQPPPPTGASRLGMAAGLRHGHSLDTPIAVPGVTDDAEPTKPE